MSTVSAYEAKTHLSSLLERARDGESITITKHGQPIARLVPIVEKPDARAVIDELRVLSGSLRIGIPFEEMVDEGRRF